MRRFYFGGIRLMFGGPPRFHGFVELHYVIRFPGIR
jgi:hypothetical protein